MGKIMTVAELADKLDGRIITGKPGSSARIEGMYCCDLLSRVMSHAGRQSAWITVHTHLNIVAVASLTELCCIIIPEGIENGGGYGKKGGAGEHTDHINKSERL